MSEVKEAHVCEGKKCVNSLVDRVYYDAHPETRICGNKAKFFENGKWYCTNHAPSEKKKRTQAAEKRLVNKKMF